jgi:hypothetical protein
MMPFLAATQATGSVPPLLKFVANRYVTPGEINLTLSGTTDSFQDYSVRFTPTDTAISGLVVALPGWALQANAIAETSDRTMAVSVEYPPGTVTSFKWSGSRQVYVPASLNNYFSDYLPISIPANTQFNIRTWGQKVTPTATWYTGVPPTIAISEACHFGAGLTDFTTGTSIPSNDGTGSYCPIGIYGVQATPSPTVGVIGDSIAAGSLDNTQANGQKGYMQRGLGNGHGWSMVARGGASATGGGFDSTLNPVNQILLPYCSHYICEVGRNDIFAANITLGIMLTGLRPIWQQAIASGCKVWGVTVGPTTTSTDGFTTTANQTVFSASAEVVRQQFNTYLRANYAAEGLFGLIDFAAAVEFGGLSMTGLWRVDGGVWTVGPTGIHPSAYGSDQLVAANLCAASLFT